MDNDHKTQITPSDDSHADRSSPTTTTMKLSKTVLASLVAINAIAGPAAAASLQHFHGEHDPALPPRLRADGSTDQLGGHIDTEEFTEAYDSTDELTGDIDTEIFAETHHQGGSVSTADNTPPIRIYAFPQAMFLDSSGRSEHTSFPWFRNGYCKDSANQYYNYFLKTDVKSAQLCQNVCLDDIFTNGLVGFNYKRTAQQCHCLIQKQYYPNMEATGNAALPLNGMGPISGANFVPADGDWKCFRRFYIITA